jgi:hypothetical protein
MSSDEDEASFSLSDDSIVDTDSDHEDLADDDVRNPELKVNCTTCGALHRNPRMVDTYRCCHFCRMILRQPHELQVVHGIYPKGALHILAASYGHPIDARRATDVSGLLQKLVNSKFKGNGLVLKADTPITRLFGDPCEGVPKVLKMRYALIGRRAECFVHENEAGILESSLNIQIPKTKPRLIVAKAMYGHPHGVVRGRGAFDVTEILQARIDQAGGSYLTIHHSENINRMLGDPCVGMRKELTLEYEVTGSRGLEERVEARGFLTKPLKLISTPCVAPLLNIVSAQYGINKTQIAAEKKKIAKEVHQLQYIVRKKEQGLPVSVEQNERVRKLPSLLMSIEHLDVLGEGRVFEVTRDVQNMVDDFGDGSTLDLKPDADLNALFGDPSPGNIKFLTLNYDIQALGDCGDASEITNSGHSKNYIIPKRGSVEQMVHAGGDLDKRCLLEASKCLSVLRIDKAVYGHPTKSVKSFDVTSLVAMLVDKAGGYQLSIERDLDLNAIFRNPARGIRKSLKVAYQCLGLAGTVHMDEFEDHLMGSLRLGYVPGEDAPPGGYPSDDDGD